MVEEDMQGTASRNNSIEKVDLVLLSLEGEIIDQGEDKSNLKARREIRGQTVGGKGEHPFFSATERASFEESDSKHHMQR